MPIFFIGRSGSGAVITQKLPNLLSKKSFKKRFFAALRMTS
jgi:hypothetical protein